MTTDKRRRELARAKAERQAQRRAGHPRGLAGTGSSVFWPQAPSLPEPLCGRRGRTAPSKRELKPPRKPRAHPP